jgi:WD40 repeat protein
MKKASLLILIWMPLITFCQSTSLLYTSFDFYRLSHNQEKCSYYASLLMQNIKSDVQKNDTNYILALGEIGDYYFNINQYDSAVKAFELYIGLKNQINKEYGKYCISHLKGRKLLFTAELGIALDAADTAKARQMIEKGAQLNCDDLNGYYPLSYALYNRDTVALKMLINGGADVNVLFHGITALHIAAYTGEYDLAKILLDGGAFVSRIDNDGADPAYYARINNHPEIEKLIRQYNQQNVNPLSVQVEHKNPVNASAISHNGDFVLTSEQKGTSVKLWDYRSKLEIKTIEIGQEPSDMEFLSDDRSFAIATNDGFVFLYRIDPQQLICLYEPEKFLVGYIRNNNNPIDVNPDDLIVFSKGDVTGDEVNYSLVICNDQGENIRKINADTTEFRKLVFDKTGKLLAGVNNNAELYIWRVLDGYLLRKLKLEIGETPLTEAGLDFDASGDKIAVSGFGNKLQVLDVKTGKMILFSEEVDSAFSSGFSLNDLSFDNLGLGYFKINEVLCSMFLDDKTVITAGCDGKIKFFDTERKKIVKTVNTGAATIYTMLKTPNPDVLLITKDKFLFDIDIKTGKISSLSKTLIKSPYIFYPDSSGIWVSNYNEINRIDLSNGRLNKVYSASAADQIIENFIPVLNKNQIIIGTANPNDTLTIFNMSAGPDEKHASIRHKYQKDAPDTTIIDGQTVMSGLLSVSPRYERMMQSVYLPCSDNHGPLGIANVICLDLSVGKNLWVDTLCQVNYLHSFSLSSNDRYFACLKNSSEIHLYDLQTSDKSTFFSRFRVNEISLLDDSPAMVNLEDEEVTILNPDTILSNNEYYEHSKILFFLHLGHGNMGDLATSPSGNYIAYSRYEVSTASVIQYWDNRIGEELYIPVDGINELCFSPADTIIAGATPQGYVTLWDIKNNRGLSHFRPVGEEIKSLQFSQDGLVLFVRSESGIFMYSIANLYDPRLMATLYFQGENYLIALPSGYYLSTRGFVAPIGFRLENRAYPFEQFDLKYNRPDMVLESIGFASAPLIEMYFRAYIKRLRMMGFTEDKLKEDFHIPEIKILDRNQVTAKAGNNKLQFKIKAWDETEDLDRLNVWVNDVPVYGMAGIDLRTLDTNAVTRTIDIDLSSGSNKIQVSALNQAGAESLKETIYIDYQGDNEKPSLYLVGIGVSEFQQDKMNLNYAVKDGRDLVRLFAGSADRFDHIYIDTLFNRQVTKENVLGLKEKLKQSRVDDQVILFLSGHGLLSDSLDFYFAAYDMDFSRPEKNGILYDDIEGLLDGIPARKKLMLIDACHSGEVDKEELVAISDTTRILADGSKGDLKVYDYKGVEMLDHEEELGLQNSFELMQELFTNLSRGSGAVVISAAAGKGYALEGTEWKNGVFTYAVINGLKNGAAEMDRQKGITVTELKDYVISEVGALTHGHQKPTCRRENLEVDWRVW